MPRLHPHRVWRRLRRVHNGAGLEGAGCCACACLSRNALAEDWEEHMLVSEVTGDLPKIIGNEEHLYEGDMTFYFRTLFFKSRNLHNPYHNFRHTLHVLWLCHKACQYYQNQLTPRQMRNLLITALFHDFDHPGHPHPGENDPDRINIRIAIAGLRRYIMPADRAFFARNRSTNRSHSVSLQNRQ